MIRSAAPDVDVPRSTVVRRAHLASPRRVGDSAHATSARNEAYVYIVPGHLLPRPSHRAHVLSTESESADASYATVPRSRIYLYLLG